VVWEGAVLHGKGGMGSSGAGAGYEG
jgi:hypothetical protein